MNRKRKFIVGIDDMHASEKILFTNYLDSKNYSWWHWITGFWLILDSTETLTLTKLLEVLGNKVAQDKTFFAIEIDSPNPDYVLNGPKESIDWLRDVWES